MKKNKHQFLLFIFLSSYCAYNFTDNFNVENVQSSQLHPLFKIECTTDELFNSKSKAICSPTDANSAESIHTQQYRNQVKKDFRDEISLSLPPESFVPCANHYFYDFSKMETTRAPQNIGLNFTALTRNLSPSPFLSPPDTMLDVGPTQIIAVTNQGLVSFDKTTGLRDGVIESTLPAFSNHFAFNRQIFALPLVEVFDPRMRYDRFTDRWFFVAISFDLSLIPIVDTQVLAPNSILIAVSDTGIITKTTKWTAYAFAQEFIFPPGDIGLFADYPTLGIDAHALYIGVNMESPAGVLIGASSIFVFPKAGLISGNPVGTAFRDIVGIFTPQGVDNFDPAPTNGFLIGNVFDFNLNANLLFLFIISNPGTLPLLTAIVPIPVDFYGGPPNAPHLGNVQAPNFGFLDTHDDRLRCAHIRNNQLFTTQHIGVDQTGNPLASADRTALRWYQIDISNPLLPSVIQQGTFFDSSLVNPRYFYYPSIMTNVRGDLSLACSTSAADQYVDALTLGRLASDPPGTLQAPVFLTNASHAYNFQLAPQDGGSVQRWGDYSYTALDPSDDMTMWTAQEFTAGTDNWGIQITQLLAP